MVELNIYQVEFCGMDHYCMDKNFSGTVIACSAGIVLVLKLWIA